MNDIESTQYLDADETWKNRITHEWGEKAARHLHLSNGFAIVAVHRGQPIGLVSVYWRELPAPLSTTVEGYIDILEVHPGYRRRGIARQLIELSARRAQGHQVYQLRSWSSEDKVEAIPMWKRFGFGLYPATTYPRDQEVRGFFVTKVLE